MIWVSTWLRGGCTSEPDGVLSGDVCVGVCCEGFLISPVVLIFGTAGSEPDPGLPAGLGAGLTSILASAAGGSVCPVSGFGAGCGTGSIRLTGCDAGFRASNGLVELCVVRGNGWDSGFGSTR